MIVSGCLGFFFMTEAVRLGGSVSVVIPFRYTRLLFSMAAGILILGEQVNAVMLIEPYPDNFVWTIHLAQRTCHAVINKKASPRTVLRDENK